MGRDEPRDVVDILYIHEHVLPLGAGASAATGKDPGFAPLSLLELLKRRGRYHPEEFARLDLAVPFDLVAAKQLWLTALDSAEAFVRSRPAEQLGCVYWSASNGTFVMPASGAPLAADVGPHFGRPAGVLPRVHSPNATPEA